MASVPGYSETFFVSKIRGLAERGFAVILFARGAKRTDLPAEFVSPWPVPTNRLLRFVMVLLVLPLTLLRAPRATWNFWKLEQHEGSDLKGFLRLLYLNAHILPRSVDWVSFGFATQAIDRECVARAIGAKMSVSLRGYDIQVYPLRRQTCYVKMWKYVDKVHSLSIALIHDASRCGLPINLPVIVIPPAVDLERFPVIGTNRIRGPIGFVTVARLHWVKGLTYSISAMKILKDRGYEFQYYIIGEGEGREQLQFEINETGLSQSISLEGQKTQSEVVSYLSSCDIYLQPSLSEGFCNALLEAQASGLLCIGSAVGGMCENIVEGSTGWLVKPRDSEALARKIEEVLNLPTDIQSAIRVAARERVKSNFDIGCQVESWDKFYSDFDAS